MELARSFEKRRVDSNQLVAILGRRAENRSAVVLFAYWRNRVKVMKKAVPTLSYMGLRTLKRTLVRVYDKCEQVRPPGDLRSFVLRYPSHSPRKCMNECMIWLT